ncbi:MAG: carboxyl transferase [Clostridia bacterium]|nr:carboxyl transferase [Clostridia bacterium]
MEKNSTVGAVKINALFDAGTFVELGSYVRRNGNPEEYEGVICGYGAIDGKLVFAFSQDSDRMKGAFDEIHAKKIEKLYEMAIKNGAPVVAMLDSAGALIYDGAAALSGYGRIMKCVSEASGVIPQIAVVNGICAGMSATIAAMFDLVVTAGDKAQLYVNPPFVLGKENGTAAHAAAVGIAAIVAENEDAANEKVKELIALMPSNNAEGTTLEVNEDDLNRTVAAEGTADELIVEIADCNKFVKLYADYAPEMIVGMASFGGIGTGVVYANGKISVGGARKAAKFVSLCDSFNIPVLTLVDSEGVVCDKDAENAPLASELAKLAFAYTSSKNAKVTVVVGKAYGAAYTLMGSKSVGADVAFALENACISILPPEAAVAFAWNDKITANKSREELETEWKEKCASPVAAAEIGEIDDIIANAELRQRICAALSMLFSKTDVAPTRRHANMPL